MSHSFPNTRSYHQVANPEVGNPDNHQRIYACVQFSACFAFFFTILLQSTVIFVSSYWAALDGHIFEYGAVKGGWYGVQYIKIAAG